MSDDPKKIFVDDDWKQEAQREKEKLAQEAEQKGQQQGEGSEVSFVGLVQLLMTQTLAAMGQLQGPGGEQFPTNFEAAKHYIDLLQVLEEKTRGNLNDDEKKIIDQVLYELRMVFVQATSGGGMPGAGPGGDATPPMQA